MTPRTRLLALACFAAAAAWPPMVGWMTWAMQTPLERALVNAWCGAPAHASYGLFGHCAACWAGSLTFIVAGLLLAAPLRLATSRSTPR